MNIIGTNAKERSRRLKIYSVVLAITILLTVFSPLFGTPQAYALPGETWQATVWRWIKDKVDYAQQVARKTGADIAFKNALKVYMTKLAEDTAVWVASAGKGQTPLFVSDPNYWKNLSNAAAGDFLDTLGSKWGVDVCKPANIQAQFTVEGTVNALLNPSNWCQKLCQRTNSSATTTDTFDIVAVSGQTLATVNLAEAEQNLSGLRGYLSSNCGTKDPYKWNVSLPESDPNRGCKAPGTIPGVVNLTAGGPCGYLGQEGMAGGPIGECIAAYEDTINRYKQTTNKDFSQCMNLCSAQRRVARCTASDVLKNYSASSFNNKNIQKVTGRDLLRSLSFYYEPGENQIGQVLTFAENAKQKAQDVVNAFRDTSNSKILPVTDPVSKKVKTSADITGAAAAQGLTQDPSGKIFSIETGSPLADAIGVFTNTLTRRLLQRIFERGLNPSTEPQNIAVVGNVVLTGAQAAREIFASVAQPDFRTDTGQTTLDDLVACPEGTPGPSNCVLDDRFRQAIDEGLTVAEAIKAGHLDPKKPFGYVSFKPDVEPDYREGYPYRSLLIMRRMRIVPVGWELAAQAIQKSGTGGKVVSLGEVIANYNTCGPDPVPYSAFCGLIDPNWVLKAPATYCKVAGATGAVSTTDYTPDPLYPDAPDIEQISRDIACVDEKSCLQQDEKGNCLAYGYCIKERPSWKFGGDQCDATFHSCDTFTDSASNEISVLTTTTQNAVCNATNAGCQAYCNHVNGTTGEFDCTPVAGTKIYLTSKVRPCGAEAESCQEFIRTTNTTNLLANGGFETLGTGLVDDPIATNTATFPGWQTVGGVSFRATSQANSGSIAGSISGAGTAEASFAYAVPLSGASFTLSFAAKKTTSGSCNLFFGIKSPYNSGASFEAVADTATVGDTWARFTKTITYPARTYDKPNLVTAFFATGGCDATLDDVQLEIGDTFSAHKDYGSTNTVYLNKNRLACFPEEVGCDLYTSATDQIPGVATATDYCPKEQVGCRAFQEMPVTENGADPTHVSRQGLASIPLIPSTGKQCSAAYVGCEEYTNLDEVARGGEGKEYYTYIRQCEKPVSSGQKTYYSWFGSDATGFQLKSYILAEAGGVYYPGDPSGGPKYQTNIDLTNVYKCNASSYNNTLSPDYSADCRQFFDASLTLYYRYYSKTISVSDDCHPLRNTVDGATYDAIPSEGMNCPASMAQCKEYRGPSGYNTRVIFSDTFEDGDTAGWIGGSPSNTALTVGGTSLVKSSGGAIATDVHSLLQEGKMYILTFWAGAYDAAGATLAAQFNAGPNTVSFSGTATVKWDAARSAPMWNSYTLGPLHLDRAPDPGDFLVFGDLIGGGKFYVDNIKLIEVSDSVFLIQNSYQTCAGAENCDRYTNRDGKEFFLKSFTRLCSENKIGCEALINTQNSDSPFGESYPNGSVKGVDLTVPADTVETFVNNPQNYCRGEESGCLRLGLETLKLNYNPVGSTLTSTYAPTYLVNDPDEYSSILCKDTELGCVAWQNKRTGAASYFRQPSPYTCEYRTDVAINGKAQPGWYRSGSAGLKSEDQCDVTSPAPAAAGGYDPVAPYQQPDPTAKFCAYDKTIPCTSDANCSGVGGPCINFAGLCPSQQAGCKEYRDPSDPPRCVDKCLLTVNKSDGKNVPVVTDTCAVNTAAKPGTCEKSSTTACNDASDCTGFGGCIIPYGCRGYWYLRQSVESNASDCNNTVSSELGCLRFYMPVP